MAQLPHATRSAVFNALFYLLKTIPPPVGEKWKTASQFLKQYDEVDAAEQPAIFLLRAPQSAEQKTYGVTKWTFRASAWIYYRTDGLRTEHTYPDQLTDQFLDNIEATFQTDLGVSLTLGGLVKHCWIDGTCYADPGISDPQAIIIIPISIFL